MTLEGALVVENAALRAVEKLRLVQLATEAHHDPLTGLANRRRLIEELEATVYRAEQPACAVLMIDLDRFKEINDSFGHSVGDDLLCLVGPRLQRALQPGDLLARMGGDEFAVLLPGADAARAREVADALGAALRDAFELDGMPLHVDASIGIALCPDHGRDRSLLLARADTAMYMAKRGRHGFDVWTPDGTAATRDRLETLEQLRTALDDDQLDVHYQPKLDLQSGSVLGVEALVRWNHPERGLLYPDVFLPLAEQAGLMRRLALRVLERSLRDLSGLAGVRPRPVRGRQPVGLQPAGRRPAGPGRDAARQLRRARRGADPGDHRGRPHGRRRPQPAGHGRAAPARRPAVDRRLRHRLLVAVLPARAAGRRAQARPQLRQPPHLATSGRRPSSAARCS